MPNTKKISSFLCDIAPIVPLPFGRRDTYSYLSTEPVPTGSLVLVPFGPREVRGIVLSCTGTDPKQETSGKLKRIRAVLEASFLTEEQLALARTISETCLTPLGKTFRHFLPTRTRERSPKPPRTKTVPFRVGTKERDILADLSSSKKPVFLEASREAALRIIAGAIRKLPKASQALVLVPERIALPGAERFLSSVFGANRVVALSSSVASGAFFSAWEKVRSGEGRVIIGTRQALFAPFRRLGLVAFLEESETLGYKQWDMSPRYDARVVGETLASLHGARLVFSGETMSEPMSLGKKQREIVHILATDPPATLPKISLVNMREERFRKNYSLFSAELNAAIADTKARNLRTFLIVSRAGLDRFSVCEECKTVPRCPSCDRALRSMREGHFRCGSCSFRTTTFPRCASCGSLSFKNIGGGTEKIEQELRRRFPGLRIVRIDERELRKPRSEHALFEAALSAEAIIGTPSSLNLGTLPKIGLVAILDAENLLSFPDFQADERFVRLVRRAGNMVASANRGSIIIQTFRPEQELLRNLRDGTERATLDRAFEDRKILRYPPFFSLFRIGFRAKEEADTERIAEEARALLSEAGAAIDDLRISPAQKPLTPKMRGKYERFVTISLPAKTPFPAPLRDVLSKLSDWTFDPDPLSLI
jgi:primosomal protein N' (replication factor Y)